MTEKINAYVELAVDYGQKLNVDLILACGTESIDNQIRFSQNKIDINKQWHTNLLELFIVVEDNKVAISGISPTSNDQVRERITALVKFAKKGFPSPFFQGIEEKISTYRIPEGLNDPNITDYREKAPDSIIACINAANTSGATRVAGSFLIEEENLYLKSSTGPSGSYSGTKYNFTIRAFQEELDASGQGSNCGRLPSSANKKIIAVSEKAGSFSKLHRGAKQAKAGIYDVIMAPTVAGGLMSNIVGMASPLAILIGQSALSDKVGEQLAPEFLSVWDNGLQPDGLETTPFDVEGTPRQNTIIFEKGVLKNFIHNTTSANMFQTTTTGNGALYDFGNNLKIMAPISTNIIFNNGKYAFDELLEGSKPAIYMTCNWYTRYTSPISTEYSTIPRDAAFLVKNGELDQPLKNFRISDNLLRQFLNIEAMGNDRTQVLWWKGVEMQAPTWVPTIRVKDCRVTIATR
jgi:predicted Zn-dependent protease